MIDGLLTDELLPIVVVYNPSYGAIYGSAYASNRMLDHGTRWKDHRTRTQLFGGIINK